MDDGVFVWHRMCHTKIPGPPADPERSAGRAAWGVFLWFLSLHEQRKGRPRGERHHGSETETSLARPPKVGAITDVVTARTNTRTWLDLSPAPLSHRDFLRAPQEEGLDRVPLKPG